MARPKKDRNETRKNRLTTYWTDEELNTLETVCKALDTNKTKFVTRSTKEAIDRLETPPEPLKKAKYEKILNQDNESLRGFICEQGHSFWVERTWPSDPRGCPICGTRSIKLTWNGVIKRGF